MRIVGLFYDKERVVSKAINTLSVISLLGTEAHWGSLTTSEAPYQIEKKGKGRFHGNQVRHE